MKAVFASHQDPDIISSLALWLEFNPALKCYTSWLWTSFLPHFGGSADTFLSIPDEGMDIPLGSLTLKAVPAHYLHSSGNFVITSYSIHYTKLYDAFRYARPESISVRAFSTNALVVPLASMPVTKSWTR